MAKIKYHSRKFLNKTHGLGAIEVSAETWEYGAGIESIVNIHDCARKVTLDFSVFDKKDLQLRTQKLELLIDELTKLQAIFLENHDAIYASLDEQEKQRKKKEKKVKEEVVEL